MHTALSCGGAGRSKHSREKSSLLLFVMLGKCARREKMRRRRQNGDDEFMKGIESHPREMKPAKCMKYGNLESFLDLESQPF
jgi:hypothetical protein